MQKHNILMFVIAFVASYLGALFFFRRQAFMEAYRELRKG